MLTKELTNEYLKGKMTDAIVKRVGSDFNTCLTPGHYSVNAEQWSNHPTGAYEYGTLIVFGDPTLFLSQLYIPHAKLYLYWRVYYKPHYQNTGYWDAWKRTVGESVT